MTIWNSIKRWFTKEYPEGTIVKEGEYLAPRVEPEQHNKAETMIDECDNLGQALKDLAKENK